MKKFYLTVAAACFASAACADLPDQYNADRQHAIASLNKHLKQECIANFLLKNHGAYITSMGSLSYNETVSRAVYQNFYWDGSDRGVAFTVPVKMDIAGQEHVRNLACFYAMTDKGLHFQLSQQMFGAF